MKSNIRSAVALAALLALGGLPATAAQNASPVGPTWDCLLSGSGQQGIAFLTFSNDFTFTGYQLLVGKQSAADSEDGRNPGGGVGRGIGTGGNASGGSGTTLFGFGFINGLWQYDQKGRVVGYFVEVLNQQTTITTNENLTSITGTKTITDTNGFTWTTNITTWFTNITYTTNVTSTTDSISFSAKVVPAKRLTLTSSTPNGKVAYRGIPQKPIDAAISGSWQAAKKVNKQDFLEFFNLLPTSLDNPYVLSVPNIYFTTNGNGPGFSFSGVSMVSVQKKIGFAFETFQGVVTNIATASGGMLSAAYGPISYPKKNTKANTKGFEAPAITPFTFQAVRQGP
jgi:hypothetical protein